MSVVDGLSQSVFTIGGALVTALSPHKYVELGHSILRAVKTGLVHEGYEETGPSYSTPSPQLANRSDDPALVHLDNLQSYLALLFSLTNNGVGEASQEDGTVLRHSPGNTRTFFQIIDQDLTSNATPGSFSYDTKRIVHEALEVFNPRPYIQKPELTIA